ncbi:hypothetical protein IJT93_02430 [bacterium]|nr:hypothetical protein [bacterium]
MACKLIDVHHYGRYEKRPKIPKDPMCLPVDIHKKLRLKVFALIAVMFGILLVYLLLGGSEKDFTLFDVLVTLAVFGGGVYCIVKVQEKVYARLQDSIYNPKGCKYQGRILSTNDPHYQLHLNYYNTHGSWELPDELEYAAD